MNRDRLKMPMYVYIYIEREGGRERREEGVSMREEIEREGEKG